MPITYAAGLAPVTITGPTNAKTKKPAMPMTPTRVQTTRRCRSRMSSASSGVPWPRPTNPVCPIMVIMARFLRGMWRPNREASAPSQVGQSNFALSVFIYV
jgi:hypothetical protein